MSRLVKLFSGTGGCLVLVCTCLSLVSLQSCGNQLVFTFAQGEGDYDPPGSTCDNAGVAYPGNPFSGWPQVGRWWPDVNYYYCAEDYYALFGRTHWGIDIDAYHTEPVIATAFATVVWAYEDASTGMGRTVKICAEGNWCATYMHLDTWAVTVGQAVVPGQVLGYADNTGFSTGTHLHYQINHPDGYAVDPAPTFGPVPETLEPEALERWNKRLTALHAPWGQGSLTASNAGTLDQPLPWVEALASSRSNVPSFQRSTAPLARQQ